MIWGFYFILHLASADKRVTFSLSEDYYGSDFTVRDVRDWEGETGNVDAYLISIGGGRPSALNSINYNLFGDTNATARNGDQRDELKLSFKKNVLDVNVNYGGMARSDATFHFREEHPSGGDLMLIGFDFRAYCVDASKDCVNRLCAQLFRFSRNSLVRKRQNQRRRCAQKQETARI
jgi:hypothetical protein